MTNISDEGARKTRGKSATRDATNDNRVANPTHHVFLVSRQITQELLA